MHWSPCNARLSQSHERAKLMYKELAPCPVLTPHPMPTQPVIPPLQPGDRLTRAEFERRLDAMPESVKAELIEGRVYISPPAFEEHHGIPHMAVNVLIGNYWVGTPGVVASDNSSLRLVLGNLPQPDTYLRVLPSHGGRTRRSPEGYIEGAPELVAEIAASSASYDLHEKLEAYRRNGVNEYLVWRTYENKLNWFILRSGHYQELAARSDGILCSEAFPGLWLDAAALLRLDLARVKHVLEQGVRSPEHAAFAARLASAGR
jgi:Uma2 family endonuclease